MAAPLHSTCSPYPRTQNRMDIQARLNSPIKVSMNLKPPSFLGSRKPSLTYQFFDTVSKSLTPRTCKKATQLRVTMMPIGTPRVPYRTPGEGTWQWVDVWNALYRERMIFIAQEINEEYSNQLLASMLYLDSIDSEKTLSLFFNCPGGDITPCMSLYDTMQSLKSPISTFCIGHAVNMAAYMLASGDKGKRAGLPSISISLEPPSGTAVGQADDMENDARELLRVRDYLFKELARHTGQPIEKIHKDLNMERYFTADEAVAYGFIDRVVEKHTAEGEDQLPQPGAGLK